MAREGSDRAAIARSHGAVGVRDRSVKRHGGGQRPGTFVRCRPIRLRDAEVTPGMHERRHGLVRPSPEPRVRPNQSWVRCPRPLRTTVRLASRSRRSPRRWAGCRSPAPLDRPGRPRIRPAREPPLWRPNPQVQPALAIRIPRHGRHNRRRVASSAVVIPAARRPVAPSVVPAIAPDHGEYRIPYRPPLARDHAGGRCGNVTSRLISSTERLISARSRRQRL